MIQSEFLDCRRHFKKLQLKGHLFDFPQRGSYVTKKKLSGNFEFLKTFLFRAISARLLQLFFALF